ncbi:hypothetical protein LXL04_001484 [Taraxacum kok-saghyz]
MKNMYRRNQMVVQKLIVTTIMGVVFGYFIGVSFPSVIIPSSIYSPFDVTMQSKSLERSFPENLGSGIYSDLKKKAKYLVTFTVGWGQRDNIDKSIKKSGINMNGQSRWYAKRFLHPDIVATYEYIFI